MDGFETERHIQMTNLNSIIKSAPRWKVVFGNGYEVIPDDLQNYILQRQFLAENVPDNHLYQIHLHVLENSPWNPLVSGSYLTRDTYHRFREIETRTPVTHVIVMHYPNGGIHGLKVHGIETEPSPL
jgi:allantoicase